MPSVVVMIPARGGSQGIPRQYVQPIAGKPMLGWTIEAAHAAGRVDRVVVSTDDPEIAEIGGRFGAEVVIRPDEMAGESTSGESALLDVLDHLKETEGNEPDLIVLLPGTSPMTAAEDIDGTIEALDREGADTALAVVPFHCFLWRPDASGDGEGINHDKRARRLRQDREPQYLESGAVYVMKTAGFREHRHRFFGKTALYEMPSERRLEINDPVDLQVAEVLLRARLRSEKVTLLPDRLDALVFDFDGVFTDNRVTVMGPNDEAVVCNRSDGLGIERLRKAGWPMLVISKEPHPIVKARCAKLKLECLHGIDEKRPALRHWLDARGFALERTLYVGNDINDLHCLTDVGCPVAVADAYPEVLRASRIILDHPGGHGALRELAELIESRYGTDPHA